MTREEAIEYWEGLRKTFSSQLEKEENHFGRMHLQTTIDVLDTTISALRQQETVTNRNGLKVVEIDQVKPLTNADHIRSMSDEELAEFLWDFNLADVSTVKMGEFGPHMFRYRLKEWLQQPAEEVDHA